MRIPPEFAHHIKRESSYATLESRAVKNWRVKLTADRDSLLFKNGWKEFFEHHDLAVGDFLLFRYNGNMHFTVQVFGRSCCEDSYVFTYEHEEATETFRRPIRLLTQKPEDSEDSTCVEIESTLCASGEIVKQPHLKPTVESTIFLPGIKGNPSFQYVLKRSGNYLRSFVYIPHQFATRYMVPSLLTCQSVTISLYNLTDPTVTACKVRIVATRVRSCRFTSYRITAGWMRFCRWNKLKCGDKCFFEVNNERSGFNVHRFKPEKKLFNRSSAS